MIMCVGISATVSHALDLLRQLHYGKSPHPMDMAGLELSATAAQSSDLLQLHTDKCPHPMDMAGLELSATAA
jgi:hypothetical protein